MFKQSSFEEDIYKSMEQHLMAHQVENQHGFNKLTKAADYLNSAAQLFDKAGLHSQAAKITELLQELSAQFSSKASEHKKKTCNCEQVACEKDHEPGLCKNKAGDKKALYIGSICDSCAKRMPKEYMKDFDQEEWWGK